MYAEVVDNFDMPGHFVVGDLSAAEINDLARFDPLALFRHNKRETNFAEPLVGAPQTTACPTFG